MRKMYTITTAFFDLNRAHWKKYTRPLETYLKNAERVLSLNDYMVIYIEPQFESFVKEQRKHLLDKTKIITTTIEELPYYSLKQSSQHIMESSDFKQGLADPNCPEVCEPLYDVVMWSKIPLVIKTIKDNPFKTSHHVWLDFGVHPHMLQDKMLGQSLLKEVPDKIKLLCRSYPSPLDLDTVALYKSHRNRLAGTLISGSAQNFRKLNRYLDVEVQDCLNKEVVDCDQSLLDIIYLKHPHLFDLYYGDWSQLITNYYQVSKNLAYVLDIALEQRNSGDNKAFKKIMDTIPFYSREMWLPE